MLAVTLVTLVRRRVVGGFVERFSEVLLRIQTKFEGGFNGESWVILLSLGLYCWAAAQCCL
jgi:hypothetical protein